MNASPAEVRDNPERSRFELDVNGRTVFASYRPVPGKIIISHTETPVDLRGRGLASTLVQGALAQIRARGMKVVPLCPFVSDYIRQHPEFADLVSQ
jgi:predicted GNAT family acetyltransferase